MMLIEEIIMICFIIALSSYCFQYSEYLKEKKTILEVFIFVLSKVITHLILRQAPKLYSDNIFHRL